MFARSTYKDSKTWNSLNPVQKTIMMTLIMLANHKDGTWWDDVKKEWVPIKRGQLITSLNRLQKACGKGVSVQNIRTCFVNLEKMGFLTYKSTKQYRLVTIVNYDFYQCPENYQQSNQQKPNKALTTNKNVKNVKNNIYIPVINHLNKKAGTNYRATTKATQRFIDARLAEGFTEVDFITAINNKVKDWTGTDMAKYLRPETLFGTKFESYLNQSISETKNNKDEVEVIR
jgi:uncharacterized phage protein (TIGR02220 family)